MILAAKITSLAVKTKGKGEDTTRTARLVLEVDDPDDWKLDTLSEKMDGIHHEIAIDENVSKR